MGAVTGAFSRAFNHEAHKLRRGSQAREEAQDALAQDAQKILDDMKQARHRESNTIHLTGHRIGVVGPYHLAIEYNGGEITQWLSAGPENGNLVGGLGDIENSVRPSDHPSKNIVLVLLPLPKVLVMLSILNV